MKILGRGVLFERIRWSLLAILVGAGLFAAADVHWGEVRSLASALVRLDSSIERSLQAILSVAVRSMTYSEQAADSLGGPQGNSDAGDTAEAIDAGKAASNKSSDVRLFFVGDVMLDRGVRASVASNFAGDYAQFLAKTDFLSDGDIVFGNLEGPISSEGTDRRKKFSFRMSPEALPALKETGFTIFSVANNHIGDWGREAFVDSLKNLRAAGLAYTGGGYSRRQAEEPTIIPMGAVKFGFIGFSDVGPNQFEAQGETAGILIADKKRMPMIVRRAAELTDFLIVSFHFGEEYKPHPSARQRKLARLAADAGAKIVIGHHPHVMEDVELYRNTLIAYSLGNFVFDQSFSKETMKGMLLDVTVREGAVAQYAQRTVNINHRFQPGLEENER